MDEPAPFGVLLQRYRRAGGLTQEALAERAGLSVRGISDLERGLRRTPQRATVEMLADAFGLGAPERAALADAAPRRPAPPGPRAPRPSPPADLPTPPTPLVGRERELAAALALLGGGAVRLLTLVGPGGVGKTRLGLQLAAELAGAFADGVRFVDLSPIHDPALVASSIARVLGVQ